ncbi:Coatomer subunit epsilon [Neolecta irregularis DAH-3]|uniref:Coatomer subunit epsilon n=1 Tax=Neolecta irregularis (strain DAH-3) TaxID=1198029 RepID=A0A1U7LNA6_NEOID|nr:Coatomer subunit epsilon [Neolecta irregularis DAH-3]|eukprot:OLL24108.1 Coatomer subunit epsilon [Neolecta irregularis DAH-3]
MSSSHGSRSLFHQGCSNLAIDPSNPDSQIYSYRSRIHHGAAKDVLQELAATRDPSLAAVKCLAHYTLDHDIPRSLAEIQNLASANPLPQVLLIAAILHQHLPEKALQFLAPLQNDIEGVALAVQIYLSLNNPDRAAKIIHDAKKWAQDDILIQLAEAWLDLRLRSYYIYEELAQNTKSPKMLVGQAVAEIQLGRFDDAQFALKSAFQIDPTDPYVLANSIVCAILLGLDPSHFAQFVPPCSF